MEATIQQIQPTREARFTYSSSEDGPQEEFVIREPTPREVSEADVFRSIIWFSYLKRNVPTEGEVLTLLKKQGRFDLLQFQSELDKLNNQITDELLNMSVAHNIEDLETAYYQASMYRKQLLDKMREKSDFTKHCVEVKADHAYHIALASICSEKANGEPVFTVYDDLGNIDIEKSHDKADGWHDVKFLGTLLENFIPFMMGFDDTPRQPEEMLLDHIKENKFKNNKESDEEADRKVKETADLMARRAKSEIEKAKKPLDEQHKETKEQVTQVLASRQAPVSTEVPAFTPEQPEVVIARPTEEEVKSEETTSIMDEPVESEPKVEMPDFKDEPTPEQPVVEELQEGEYKLHPVQDKLPEVIGSGDSVIVPSQKEVIVKPGKVITGGFSGGGRGRGEAEVEIDLTRDVGGVKTGNEDIVGDGSGRPAGIVVRSPRRGD